ncbi:hypothetical protein, partial [Enterobacter hormaechei]
VLPRRAFVAAPKKSLNNHYLKDGYNKLTLNKIMPNTFFARLASVSYRNQTQPTNSIFCRNRWSPYH